MDISLFLAQSFGLFFVISGVGMLLRPSFMRSMMNTFLNDHDRIVMVGMFTLLIGIPLVLVHNVWDGTWRVVVTIIVWATLIKGVIRVLFPSTVASLGHKLVSNPSMVKGFVWITVLLGVYLLYVGFGM